MRTVLIIEDEETVRDAVGEALEEEGYRVVKAANGQEGFDAMAASQKPDLILLDLRMPVMTGAEFLRIKRAEFKELTEIPVIAISGSRQTDFPGLVAVLPKPFTLDRLIETVQKHCPKSAAPSAHCAL